LTLAAGTRIADRYVVEALLARGGMGAVYLAHDIRLGAEVALKVTASSGAAEERVAERFEREARIGHRLGVAERGFVRALDWGRIDDSRLYLVMDLVKGAKSLDLSSGALEERLERWRRAASLVARAHAMGVIHRDIKPANFLQAPDGSIFLTDFGLAKLVSGDDGPGG
jgi:eukaryotic-like serine/threonine-protein kinase